MSESCETCKFMATGPSGKVEDGISCRRYPPVVMFAAIPTRPKVQALGGPAGMDIGWTTASSHPATRPDRWCGEYQHVPHSAIFKQ